MCGIAGIIKSGIDSKNVEQVKQMVGQLQHRGPDEAGIFIGANACLGHTRLSIIDLSTGSQPIPNEDQSLWIIYNGEVFNYPELRELLIKRGHRFTTNSDTEVILHGYEEYGADFLGRMNGQFALAIWDSRKSKLFCARDRLGVRPFYYFFDGAVLVFASELKSILATQFVEPEINPVVLHQLFTFWCPLPDQSIFKNIKQLPAGHYLELEKDKFAIKKYWQLTFPEHDQYQPQSEKKMFEELHELLIDASLIRLRADVPVGAYLSGGLDSSIITAIIKNYTSNPLETFSISFAEAEFDEKNYQQMMIQHLKTDHNNFEIQSEHITENFLRTVWHCEAPIYRTAPIPMMLLSALVRQNNRKVVLTGEGADEFFGGYNIFKEALIRRFWAREPQSQIRPLLFQKIYPYLNASNAQNRQFMIKFFSKHLDETDNVLYSHLLRWENNASLTSFLSEKYSRGISTDFLFENYRQRLPEDFQRWSPLSQAQYLEIDLYMSNYLLSSQGDRVAMANSVEGRFPFLDYRVVEFASRLLPVYKLNGLNEKYILKKTFGHLLPAQIAKRSKQPYRAPMASCFFPTDGKTQNSLIDLLFSENRTTTSEYFNQEAVQALGTKWQRAKGQLVSERENMAVILLLSTLVLDQLFISERRYLSTDFPYKNLKVVYETVSDAISS